MPGTLGAADAINFRRLVPIYSVAVPRPRRNIIPNRVYLVSQQGNKRDPVYVDGEDRAFATRLLRMCSRRYGVKVIAFGYGSYEGRWLLRPSSSRGLSCLMRDMQSAYSRYLNQKYNHRPCCAHRCMKGEAACHCEDQGILESANWTARFKAVEIDPEHLWAAFEQVRSLGRLTDRRRSLRSSRGRPARRYGPVVRVLTGHFVGTARCANRGDPTRHQVLAQTG